MQKLLLFLVFATVGMVSLRPAEAQVTLKAAAPAAQQGSTGEDRKGGSLYGQVLGHDWGGHTGDWAQYSFPTDSIAPAYLHLRYAREMAGASHLRATLDGIDHGELTLPSTGGWGDRDDQFHTYEHYHPLTDQPLSGFRDYMHSWWIDTILRHVAGMEVQDDGSLVIDALPMGVTFYALKGAPYRGHKIDLLWNDASAGKGLVVRCDGRVVRRAPTWKPGDSPIHIQPADLSTE